MDVLNLDIEQVKAAREPEVSIVRQMMEQYWEAERKHAIERLRLLDELLGREPTIERRQRPR
jgi:hypothetical protein